MNLKKLSLLLIFSVFGNSLSAMDTQYEPVCIKALFKSCLPFSNHYWFIMNGPYVSSRLLPNCSRTEALAQVFSGQIDRVAQFEDDINALKKIRTWRTKVSGGIASIAAGIGAFTTVCANFQPRNRILGTLSAAATAGLCVGGLVYSFFTPYINRSERTQKEYCDYMTKTIRADRDPIFNKIKEYRSQHPNQWTNHKKALEVVRNMEVALAQKPSTTT